MKLLLRSLPLLLWLLPVLEAKPAKWSSLLREERRPKRKLQEKTSHVRGEKKDPEEDEAKSGKGGKKKLGKKDKCNRDRRAVSFTTTFSQDDVNPISGAGIVGVEFDFEGDYTGTWTQTQIEINEEIVLGHDHLTFFDAEGEIIGVVTTQFDGTGDMAIVTAGYGEFACAQGSPVIEFPEDDTTMVNVVWDLCVCYQ